MIAVELIPYDPASHERTGSAHRELQKPHTLLDVGGISVLVILVIFFITPMIIFAMRTGNASIYDSRFELRMLIGAGVLATLLPLVQIVIQIRRLGGSAIRGNRDNYPVLDGLAGRVARSHANLLESLVPFAIAVIAASLAHVSNRWTAAASALYLFARSIHLLSYMLGITVVRSSAFYAGAAATLVIFYQTAYFMLIGS
jgi:uncharacterized MAPEG superfamily protein